MQALLSALLCLWCLTLPGCGGGTAEPISSEPPVRSMAVDQEFSLRVGQEARFPEEGLSLVLRAVPEDSRCPEDASCVWEGNARLQVDLRKTDQDPATVELNTSRLSGSREGVYLRYVIKLISLAPNPRTDRTIAAGDYVAVLMVSKQ